MEVIKMAKKQYRVEVTATDENIAALKAANIDFTLYEVNEVKRESGSFASGSNFATVELLLKEVNEIDTTDYTAQQLKNYCAGLQRELYGKPMEKVVKVDTIKNYINKEDPNDKVNESIQMFINGDEDTTETTTNMTSQRVSQGNNAFSYYGSIKPNFNGLFGANHYNDDDDY